MLARGHDHDFFQPLAPFLVQPTQRLEQCTEPLMQTLLTAVIQRLPMHFQPPQMIVQLTFVAKMRIV
ncbi:hypothetical protein CQ065_08960 [Pseudomonas sp. MYb187]|nr:hypothetical protein CQ065_08960 [Pseudomonas sp. MYb187]